MMHACANTCRIKLKQWDVSRSIKFWSKVIVCVTTLAFIALYIAPAGSHQNFFLKKLPISRKELMSSLGLGNNPKSVLVRTSETRFGQQAVKRTPYTRRNNMGPCLAKFGKVTVFIGFLKNAMEGKKYRVAQSSIECYLKGVNYQLVTVNLENDERTKEKCQKYKKLHVLDTLIPDAIQERKNCHDVWLNATSYDTYMAVVSCVRQALGATRLWPGKLRFYRKAHGWVRDGFLTKSRWHDGDFMFHGWKHNSITAEGWGSPFTEMPDLKSCGNGKNGWHWDETKHVDVEEIKADLANYEESAGQTYPSFGKQVFFLTMPVIGQCYPDCERLT